MEFGGRTLRSSKFYTNYASNEDMKKNIIKAKTCVRKRS